jgi:anaerobic selenocysteine-containing dehydrogenase
MDIWVNDEDFASYQDGELVKVENEIGAVYCTLRKTKRCVSGYVGLHQGAWFDPREIDGKIVDVGGCCNTLMASKPSRIDHGNAQQSAMVKISRVN